MRSILCSMSLSVVDQKERKTYRRRRDILRGVRFFVSDLFQKRPSWRGRAVAGPFCLQKKEKKEKKKKTEKKEKREKEKEETNHFFFHSFVREGRAQRGKNRYISFFARHCFLLKINPRSRPGSTESLCRQNPTRQCEKNHV